MRHCHPAPGSCHGYMTIKEGTESLKPCPFYTKLSSEQSPPHHLERQIKGTIQPLIRDIYLSQVGDF